MRPFILLFTLFISGCASIPLGIKLASLAGSGITYLSTGKTPSGHALSLVTQQDCAFVRLVEGGSICIEKPGDTPVVDEHAGVVMSLGPEMETLQDAAAVEHYWVIGNFAKESNAVIWFQRYSRYEPRIQTIGLDDNTFYRVIALSAPDPLADPLRLQLFRETRKWPAELTLCRESLTPPPCVNLPQHLVLNDLN